MSDSMLHPHNALIYLMVIISAADREMTDAELRRIGDVVRTVPIFEGFDEERLVETARECARMLSEEGGLDQVLNVVVASLPARLAPTAYALACEVAQADHHVEREEIVLLK